MLYSVRLVNVQSIDDITYDLSEGLNVIIAENNTGKSVLMKVIDILPRIHKLDTDERKQYINFNAGKADIYFYCSTGFYWVEICRNVTNFYGGENPESCVFLGNELPNGLRQGLSLLVCEDNLVANLITEDQSKFLVESDSKINYSIFRLMTTDENSEALIKGCEDKIKELTGSIKMKEGTRDYIAKELSRSAKVDVSQQEFALCISKPLIDLGESLVPIIESLSNVHKVNLYDAPLKELVSLGTCVDDICGDLRYVRKISTPNVPKGLLDFAINLESIKKELSLIKPRKSMAIPSDKSISLLQFGLSLDLLSNDLKMVRPINLPDKISVEVLGKLNELSGLVKEIKSIMSDIEVLEDSIDDLKYELDSLDGEVYDCPIHGSIKYINGKECVPYNS